jgi:hypothetical protein
MPVVHKALKVDGHLGNVGLLGCRSRVDHQHQPKEGSHVGYIADRSHPEVVRRQGGRECFQVAPGG